jgi:hypothetical protein
MSWPYEEVEFASQLTHYVLCSALALLQWASIGLRAVRKGRIVVPGARASSDAYWFLPVFAWGVDSTVYVAQYYHGTVEGALWIGWPLSRFLVALAMLGTLLASCFAAQWAAPRVGLPARPAQASMPVSVVAAVVCGFLVWGLALVMVMPLPHFQRGLSLNQRLPCLPEELIDVGTNRPVFGCRIWDGSVEYFVATWTGTVDYIETADAGLTTREGIRVGSAFRDVEKVGGRPVAIVARGFCGSELPSGWIARFDTKVCSGKQPRPDEEVRRLFKRNYYPG